MVAGIFKWYCCFVVVVQIVWEAEGEEEEESTQARCHGPKISPQLRNLFKMAGAVYYPKWFFLLLPANLFQRLNRAVQIMTQQGLRGSTGNILNHSDLLVESGHGIVDWNHVDGMGHQ